MKAIISTGYGSPEVLKIKEINIPEPKENEILVAVHAAVVSAADTMLRKGTPKYARLFLGLTKPKNPVPGTGFAGVVESVGKLVTKYKKGDEVFGETTTNFGAHAEYVCIDENGVVAKKPANMTFGEAAPVCDGALTSINFLKNLANIQPGQRILINGASGGLGTSAVQLAKYFGAEVTGVCSTKNLELVKSLGADLVIDYTKTDFTNNGRKYDIIYDTVGKSSFWECRNALTANGIYMSPVLQLPLLFQMIKTSIIGLFTKSKFTKKAKFSATGVLPATELRKLLNQLEGLIEGGIITSFIDKKYSLDQIVEAHTYVDTGRKRGNVVLSLQ